MILSVVILICSFPCFSFKADENPYRRAGEVTWYDKNETGTISGRATGLIQIVLGLQKLHFGGRVDLSGKFQIDTRTKTITNVKGKLKGGRLIGDLNNNTQPWTIVGTLTVPVTIRGHRRFKDKQLYVENIPVTGTVLDSSKSTAHGFETYRYYTKIDVEIIIPAVAFTVEEAGHIHCGMANEQYLNRRIANGEELWIHKYPWNVFILQVLVLGKNICGGTLLTPDRILTAAHCVQKPIDRRNDTLGYHLNKPDNVKNFVVYLGAHYVFGNQEKIRPLFDNGIMENVKVKKIQMFPHNSFDTDETVNCSTIFGMGDISIWKHHDVAMMHLKKRVTLDYFKDVICLPNQLPKGVSYNEAIVVGWGFQEDLSLPGYLKVGKVLLSSPPRIDCHTKDGTNFDVEEWSFTNYFVNASQVATCGGDSGSPMSIKHLDKYFIIGVTQGYFGAIDSDQCVPPQFQRTVKVQAHIDWIEQSL